MDFDCTIAKMKLGIVFDTFVQLMEMQHRLGFCSKKGARIPNVSIEEFRSNPEIDRNSMERFMATFWRKGMIF